MSINKPLTFEAIKHLISEEYGICNLLVLTKELGVISQNEKIAAINEMHAYLRSIGKHSGKVGHPVSHPEVGPISAYHSGKYPLWDTTTAYGKLRTQVFNHLISFTNDNRQGT